MRGRGREQARKRDPERGMAVMMVAGERAERTAFAAGISGRSRQQLAGQNPCYFSFEDQVTAAV